MRTYFSFMTALLIGLSPAFADEAYQPTFEEELTQNAGPLRHDKIITLAVENDLFGGNGTDQNYTSGVRLSYFDIDSDFPDIANDIADLVPTIDLNNTSSVFYSLGNNLYTPDDIQSETQDPNDRPWAAFTYGSIGMTTVTKNHIDELEATFGMVGPAALGEPIQRVVHKIVDSPKPRGWGNQLKNEPGLMLSWQRRWPNYQKLDVMGLRLSATPYGGTTLGNVHTYANVGFDMHIAPADTRWEDPPVRVRPSMPGTGYFERQDGRIGWYLFGGVEGRLIGRNIFLDGNTFTDSHSVDKNYFVGDANAGLALTYEGMRISYTAVHRTKEFKGQQESDLFGALSVGYRF